MGKAFAAVVRLLVALFIIAVVGYNTWEINRLQAEVRALRAANPGVAVHRDPGVVEQIAEARSHAERATALLKQKKLSEAAEEMKAASQATERASGNAQAESRNTIAEMQRSLNQLSEQTGKLWKKAEDSADKVKGAPKADASDTKDKEDEPSSNKQSMEHTN